MAAPSTKEELQERVLEMLGSPVIQINIAPSQLENAVDDAVEYWSDFHVDGQDNTFIKFELTQADIDNGYVVLPASIFAVLDVIDTSATSGNWMNYEYGMMRDTMMSISGNKSCNSGGLSSLVIAKSYMADIRSIMNPKAMFDYRYYKNQLHIIGLQKYKEGDILIAEVMGYLYKESFNVWGDRSLRKLAAAYAKKTWGMNLKKFSGVTLPSGLTLNGDAIYSDALQEIEQLEEYIQGQQEPLGIILG